MIWKHLFTVFALEFDLQSGNADSWVIGMVTLVYLVDFIFYSVQSCCGKMKKGFLNYWQGFVIRAVLTFDKLS